jgi:hypothetical protein
MRTYPKLTEQATSRDFIEAFGGYNHNLRIGENEFYDMKNLSSSNYPVLSTREKRGTYNTTEFKPGEVPVALFEKDGLCVVTVTPTNTSVYDLGIRRDGELLMSTNTYYSDKTTRTIVSMGAYIVIFPDKKYINTAEIGNSGAEVHYIEHRYVSEYYEEDESTGEEVKKFAKVTYQLCKADGTAYTPNTISDTEPTDVESGHIWLDTSVVPNSLKLYSSANKMWTPISSTYIKIESLGIHRGFEVGDAVRISGIAPEQCKSIDFATGNAASIIQAKGTNYIVVIGMMKDKVSAEQENELITVQRVMPEMDFIFENNNRLWGCRYGENRDGKIVNEIYASKLGDFKNWEYFAGTSQDSYMVSLGADGEFTGAISYLGNPLFFRQNCIHTIYGGYPAQYQLQTTECRGVQTHCGKSLVVVDGVLYYKSPNGVSAYTGSMPIEIGTALGEQSLRYIATSASGYKHKYYLELIDGKDNNKSILFVYDAEKGVWHKEGEFDGTNLCPVKLDYGAETLCYLQNVGSNTYTVKMIEGIEGYTDTDSIDWFAETGVIGCSSPDKKYISRMSIRLSTKIGARVYVFAEYDSSGTWEQIGAITSPSLNTFTFPIRPKRCDHFRLRIMGTDEAKIYSISKTLEQGSDI